MPQNIVAHPETGEPVLKQESYTAIERSQLEAEVNQKQSEVDAAVAALEAHNTQAAALTDAQTKAQAALEESKSNVARYDEIKPQPAADAGTEGASGDEPSADATGDTPDASSEPSGDSGDGDAAAEVVVPVTVEDTADQY